MIASDKTYAWGHNKARLGTGKLIPEVQLCHCGCGDYANPGRRFIINHSNYIKGPVSEETKIRMRRPKSEEGRANIKEAQNRPEVKAKRAETNAKPEVHDKRSRSAKEVNARPGMKEKKSKSAKIALNKPDVRDKHLKSAAVTNAKPEVKERRSTAAIINNNKLGARERKSQTLKITNAKPEVKERRSKSQKIAQNKPGVREQRSITTKIFQNRLEVKENNSQKKKQNWQDPNFVKKQMKARNIKQNKMEVKLENIATDLFPNEYKFVGHGEFIIAGKCPDFVNINGQKKIIELYGDYWHDGDNPQDRIDLFAKYGYNTLVVWEHELKDIENLKIRLTEFHSRVNPYAKHGEF